MEQDPLGRPLRAVVNNAGIAVNAPLEMVPLDELRRQTTRPDAPQPDETAVTSEEAKRWHKA